MSALALVGPHVDLEGRKAQLADLGQRADGRQEPTMGPVDLALLVFGIDDRQIWEFTRHAFVPMD